MTFAWIVALLRGLGLAGLSATGLAAWLRRAATTPATGFLAGVLAAALALGWAYRRGEASAAAEARAAAAESRVAALEFDLAVARRLRTEAEAARAADDAATADLMQRITDYETRLADRPACGFDGDDVRLLHAAQGLDPGAADRAPRAPPAAGRFAAGDAAAPGSVADCRRYAAQVTAAAAEANRRIARGRKAWERMRALYGGGRP